MVVFAKYCDKKKRRSELLHLVFFYHSLMRLWRWNVL